MTNKKNQDLKKVEVITDPVYNNRDMLIATLSQTITKLKDKSDNGRFRNPETDRLRLEYDKAVITGANALNRVLKDKQIDEIQEDIRTIKNELSIAPPPEPKDKEELVDNLKEVEQVIKKLDDN